LDTHHGPSDKEAKFYNKTEFNEVTIDECLKEGQKNREKTGSSVSFFGNPTQIVQRASCGVFGCAKSAMPKKTRSNSLTNLETGLKPRRGSRDA